MMDAKETIIKSALKYLVKMQIEEGGVGFAVDNDHDHDCCWDDVLAWLEAQPSEDCVSREALVDKATSWDTHFTDSERYVSLSDIMALPSVTPQASEEDIHREREQAYMLGYEDASKKFRTEPCEDCISRQAVLKELGSEPMCWTDSDAELQEINDYRWFRKIIETTKPVKPQYTDEEIDKIQAVEQAYVDKMVELAVEEVKRPKGKWIRITNGAMREKYICSECGRQIEDGEDGIEALIAIKYPYCHCGAEMSGGGEGEET